MGAAALAVLVAVIAACQPVKPAGPPAPPQPPPPPSQYCHPSTPTNAAGYQAAFDGLRAVNAGLWVAMDGGTPVHLGGNRTLWLFGDVVLGRWQPGGPVDPYWGLDNNGFVVQTGNCFRPIREPLPDPAPNEWVWPTGAVVSGGQVLVFGQHMRKAGSGGFDFTFVDSRVYRFSLSSLSLQSHSSLPVPTSPNYGEAVYLDRDNNMLYAYGRKRQPRDPNCSFFCPPVDHQYVARAPLSGIGNANNWQFWGGGLDPALPIPELWLPAAQANQATPILFDREVDVATAEEPVPEPPSAEEAPAASFRVAQWNGAYLGSAFPWDVIGRDIETWDADQPQGPWVKREQTAVDVSGSVPSPSFPYGGRVVLDLPGVAPMALWSVNRNPFEAVLSNPTLYKVHFAQPHPDSYQ